MAVTGSPELLVVMGANATPEQVEEVVARISEAGADAHVTPGDATVIGVVGERELLATLPLESFPGRRAGRSDPQAVQAGFPRERAADRP